MSEESRGMKSIRMCLNHSQSGIEQGLLELDQDFHQWQIHPHQRATWSKLMEHIISFRWVLDQHFTRVAGEGYLEEVACSRLGMYGELRDIECWQCRIIDELDAIIHDVQDFDAQRDDVAEIAEQFRILHREILDEESQERLLVERTLA
jgi:hypothetical protein